MKYTRAMLSGGVLALIVGAGLSSARETDEIVRLGLRGVHFVANDGQWEDAGVLYGFRSRGLDVAFRDSALSMHLRRDVSSTTRDREGAGLPSSRSAGLVEPRESDAVPTDTQTLVLDITFPGSNPSSSPIGIDPQSVRFNYFLGDDSSKWRTNVPSFGAIVYPDLYPGIDLHVTGSDDGILKYEFHCAPGADSSAIRIHYDGIESLCVNSAGDLCIDTTLGTLLDSAPLVWQESATPCLAAGLAPRGSISSSTSSPRTTLPAHFTPLDSRTYAISLDTPPDPSLPLIIDPDIEWMYYIGGSSIEGINGIVLDSGGNAIVVGDTASTDFSGRTNSHHGGTWDAFVSRLSSTGAVEWMTYLGGSGIDEAYDVDVDASDAIVVTGYTESSDFAGRNNSFYGYRDAFVVRVHPAGQIDWMTYLGGAQGEFGNAVAVDRTGAVPVTGDTNSVDFAGRNNSRLGGGDIFVLRVRATGVLDWMTYLGGSLYDYGYDIALARDGSDGALVTGSTQSADFAGRINATYGNVDAYVAQVRPTGTIAWMVYLGGSGSDYGNGIAVDDSGAAIVTGLTASTDFVGRNNTYHGGIFDAFVAYIQASGSVTTTYLGGSDLDASNAVILDRLGAVITGYTWSTDFARRTNSHHGGTSDAFVAHVPPSGGTDWMTYLGGSRDDFGNAAASEPSGTVLVAGLTRSNDFDGRSNSYQGGNGDGFVVRLRTSEGPRLAVAATCPGGGPIEISWHSATPRGRIALLFGRREGIGTIPIGNECAGTSLGLVGGVRVIVEGTTGASGSATIIGDAGAGACGGHMQLLDITPCAVSNVVRIE